ncbi:class I adenylate-forming enzyme family protein [Sanguibacter suarezii]|uniref:class I adenylate-forming enzyme family protein n=1 Tax=Sanguibacter suarezii TaxID=60921 RepID=UPI00083201FF|nr:AMP-binding protein [Sanguibacter suarezii]
MPVARQVLAHAAAAPERVAVRSDAAPPLTYAGLAARARAGAAALARDGVRPGQVVAIDLAGATDTLVALLAVDLAGAVALMCDGSWTPAQRSEILAATGPDHHLTTLSAVDLPAPEAPVEVSDDDLAWGGFTSGSTGRPRAVVRSRGSWTRSFAATSDLTGISAGDTVLVPGPLSTSLFCFGAVHALAAGATVRLTPSIAAALGGVGGVGGLSDCDVVHLVPGALGTVLDALDSPAPPPSRLRTAVVGGAALPASVRERAAAHGISVIAYYGATELSFVAADPDGKGLRAFPGVEIEVRDPSTGQPLASTYPLGQVWVRSPWIAHGYLAGAAGPLRTADGWASVGDLAELTAPPASRLVLRGRGTGAIAVGAATVVPEDVEAVLRTVPGVADVVVLGTPHPRLGQVVTAVVVGQDGDPDWAALERASREALSPAQRPRRWFAAATLPVTGTGKPARAVVQDGLKDQDPAYRPARHGPPTSSGAQRH